VEDRAARRRLDGPLRADEPGGSQRLAGLLERYGGAIEADLAFRGVDLAQLWRQRRWRFLLNLIEHLPRTSAFAEAVAEDDELADETVKHLNPDSRRTMPVSEYGPAVELLAAIYDRLGQQITATVAAAGAKRPPKPKPFPRPVTAIERARRRRSQSGFNDIVAAFAPHEVKSDT
jgi:hypothetical protein